MNSFQFPHLFICNLEAMLSTPLTIPQSMIDHDEGIELDQFCSVLNSYNGSLLGELPIGLAKTFSDYNLRLFSPNHTELIAVPQVGHEFLKRVHL